MELVIITRGRVGAQHTLKSIPPKWLPKTSICCPPNEQHPIERFIHEPFPMNYSQKFQYLLDGADGKLAGKKVVILDDDLRFSVRRNTSLVSSTPEELSAGFDKMEVLLDVHPLVGFHPRAMGNTAPIGVALNRRINALQGLNLSLIGDVKVDHWPILADMVLNLTLLTRGQTNALICDPFWDQVGSSNAPGGCSLHRTWEQQRDAVFGLKELFPEFVTIKQKAPKSGWWGQDKPRYDFVIRWKKAAEYGARNAKS